MIPILLAEFPVRSAAYLAFALIVLIVVIRDRRSVLWRSPFLRWTMVALLGALVVLSTLGFVNAYWR